MGKETRMVGFIMSIIGIMICAYLSYSIYNTERKEIYAEKMYYTEWGVVSFVLIMIGGLHAFAPS